MDLRFATMQSTSTLRKLGYANSEGSAINVDGTDFIDVVSVEINGTRSPAFTVFSATRLTADIPDQQIGKSIQSVTVYRALESATVGTSVIRFDLATTGIAEGRTLLTQRFIKLLLTTPGSDIFRKDMGTDLRSLIGSTLPAATLRAKASFSVEKAAQFLRREQALRPVSTPSEMLKSATVLSAQFTPETSTLDLRIRIMAMDGTSTDAGMTI
jgi:hypothetical protein